MLGWEFPPHISGGLGTACAGLVQGLAKADVGVTFVVPRAHGDEDQRFAQVLGCNLVDVETEAAGEIDVPIVRTRLVTSHGTTVRTLEAPAASPRSAVAGSERALRRIEIESSLSPYSTAPAYVARLID